MHSQEYRMSFLQMARDLPASSEWQQIADREPRQSSIDFAQESQRHLTWNYFSAILVRQSEATVSRSEK